MNISVAMATYNGQKFIFKQLESIRLQQRPVDEVIISDDNSTDNTVEIIKKYIEKYNLNWKLVFNSGRGVQDNFFNALKNVTGDVVILSDQDDEWLPNKSKYIENVFSSRNVMCLNTSFQYIDENDYPIAVSKVEGLSNNNLIPLRVNPNEIIPISLSLVFQKNISPGMTMAVSKYIIDTYVKITKRAFIHDWEINCIAAMYNGLFYSDVILTKYRIHKDQKISISNLFKERFLQKLKRKIFQVKNLIPLKLQLISELKMISNDGNKEFLKAMEYYYNIRKKVAIDCNRLQWGEEIKLYNRFKRFGFMDLRYCFIDFFASFIKK